MTRLPKMYDMICTRCKMRSRPWQREPVWTCRVCRRSCCEHLCSNKTSDGEATCIRCKK